MSDSDGPNPAKTLLSQCPLALRTTFMPVKADETRRWTTGTFMSAGYLALTPA